MASGCLNYFSKKKKKRKKSVDKFRSVNRGVQEVQCTPSKSAKRSTFSHKVGQKWGFCKRVKGDEVQKVHFLGPKGPHFGVPPLPSILAMGLDKFGIKHMRKFGLKCSSFLRSVLTAGLKSPWVKIIHNFGFLCTLLSFSVF